MSHLFLDVHDCDPDLLRSESYLTEMIRHSVDIAGMTMVDCRSYKIGQEPDKWGVTAFAVLKESHMSVHTWPERNYCAIDLFSCKLFNVIKVVEYLKKSLGPNPDLYIVRQVPRRIPE